MPGYLDNAAVADRLEALAGLLDLAGASYYTARAYRRAAGGVRPAPPPIPRPAQPRRRLLLHGSRALLETIAAALGGEVAGDPRRWRDVSERFAVVCAAEQPGPVVDAFAELPAIVALVERSERRVLGVTVEGVPV